MNEWTAQPLADVIELIGGGTPKTSSPEYWGGDIPWLSVVDFNTGRKFVVDTEKKITEKGLKNSSTKLLNKGDIIISARGTVGAMAVLTKPMTFNQSCYGIRGVPEKSITDYIYYLAKEAIAGLQQIAHGGVFDTLEIHLKKYPSHFLLSMNKKPSPPYSAASTTKSTCYTARTKPSKP